MSDWFIPMEDKTIYVTPGNITDQQFFFSYAGARTNLEILAAYLAAIDQLIEFGAFRGVEVRIEDPIVEHIYEMIMETLAEESPQEESQEEPLIQYFVGIKYFYAYITCNYRFACRFQVCGFEAESERGAWSYWNQTPAT